MYCLYRTIVAHYILVIPLLAELLRIRWSNEAWNLTKLKILLWPCIEALWVLVGRLKATHFVMLVRGDTCLSTRPLLILVRRNM